MGKPFRRRIILSDDIGRSLSRVDSFLGRAAFDIQVGRTGEEILALVRRDPPDAILTNYYLPGLKGDEVCRALKADPATAGVPLVVVGPLHPAAIGESCRRAGCDEFVIAPAGPTMLLQKLAGSLGLEFRLHARLQAVISLSFGRIVREFLGYTKDISEGGILVETLLELERGRRLYLRLYLDDREEPIVTRATVLRSERVSDDDQFLVGMQFQPLRPESAARLRDYIRARAEEGRAAP